MAFFIRAVGALTPDCYMAGKSMVYMNDHNWHDAVVPIQSDDNRLRNNGGDGMFVRMYLTPYVGGAANLLMFTHLDGFGKFATPRVDFQYPLMDSPILSNIINLLAILTVDLIDPYGQEYFFSYFGATPTGPIIYYLTLDYSPVMGRSVLKCSPSINSPLSAFTLSYTKGTGPVMYEVPYYIKTRPPTIVNGVHAEGYRLKASPDGKVFQVLQTDTSPETRFFFLPVPNAPVNVYYIRTYHEWFLCITDTGKIEPRMSVGPWEQFEVARDWYVPGRFTITKRFENDPYNVFGFRFNTVDVGVKTWRVGSDSQTNNDSFEMHPVVPGFYE